MSQAVLRTQRLSLVPLADEHIDLEVELDADPEVMRYLTGYERTRAQVLQAHRLRLASADVVSGLGFWAGFADREFVGWWLLEPPGWEDNQVVEGEAELGYRLVRRRWRQGLASEGGRELLRHAFEDLGLRRVFGLTRTANTASRRTLAAIGMRHIRTFGTDSDSRAGAEHGEVEYEITRTEWASAQRR